MNFERENSRIDNALYSVAWGACIVLNTLLTWASSHSVHNRRDDITFAVMVGIIVLMYIGAVIIIRDLYADKPQRVEQIMAICLFNVGSLAIALHTYMADALD